MQSPQAHTTPSAKNDIKYVDVVSGRQATNLDKLPPIEVGYDSYFTITKKPKNFIDPTSKGLNRYLSALPLQHTPLTLGEGDTPLVPSKVFDGVYIKNEGSNPTGNFKDRESAVALAYAHEQNLKNLVIASSGNAALSAALYSRIYDTRTTCYIPDRTSEKKKDILNLFGARVHVVGSTYEESYHYLLNNLPMGSINITSGILPLRSDGVKTIAYEIWEELGKVPDAIVCPAGNGSAQGTQTYGNRKTKPALLQ